MRWTFTFLTAALLLFQCQTFAQRVASPEEVTVSLNGDWLFCIDSLDEGTAARWHSTTLPAQISRTVKVPHTWNVDPGTEEYYGTAWYQREIDIPQETKGKSVRLKFNAVYRDAVIYLNGQQIAKHYGSGYTAFYADASKAARKGKNLLTVSVNNQFSNTALPYGKSFDWANDGGITRSVSLHISNPSGIDYILADARPVPGTKAGQLQVQTVLLDRKSQKPLRTRLSVTDAAQQVVFTQTQNGTPKDGKLTTTVQIPEVQLWHFDHPNLYQVRVDVMDKNTVIATKTVTIGFRSIEARNGKIFLNGEPVRLSALEWMPGSHPDYGMAEPAAILYGNLEHLKKLNAVFTRFHWQQDEALLDWCDRNGLLVQEEIPLWGGATVLDSIKSVAMMQADEMVLQHFNHPSVIAWGVGNEHSGQYTPTHDYVKHMYGYIKAMDSSRLVNYVSNTIQYNPRLDATVFGDVIMWNEYFETWFGGKMSDAPAMLDSIHKYHPEKPVVVSEYGVCEPAFAGGDPRRIAHMISHTALYETRPFVAGAIYFSLNDYRTFIGEEGTGKRRQRVHGMITLDGELKPSYHMLRNLFSPIIVTSMQSSPDKASISVTVTIPGGMPAYTLTGYTAQVSSASGAGEMLRLPIMEPGKQYKFTLKNQDGDNRQIVFSRPGGYAVISVPVNR